MMKFIGLLILTAICLGLLWVALRIGKMIAEPFKAIAKPILKTTPLTALDFEEYWIQQDQKRVRLELAQAKLRADKLRPKQSQRLNDSDEETTYNPSTGLPMLTDCMDIGGNDCSCIGEI